MSDYRNLPFIFGFGGQNIVSAPELLQPGQYTRFRNVRYRREGTLEGRYGAENFVPLFDQSLVYPNTYPVAWNIGELQRAAYVGKIYKTAIGGSSITTIDGWITFHKQGQTPLITYKNTSDYRVFINGLPVADASTVSIPGERSAAVATRYAFQPTGFSVIRTVAKTGKPILIIDGTHYIILDEVDVGKEYGLVTNGAQTFQQNYSSSTTFAFTKLPVIPAFRLGMATPVAPTLGSYVGSGVLTGTYLYGMTYYNNKTGFESPLSATLTTTPSAQNVTLTLTCPDDPQITHIRIWRKGGTIPNSYRLVGSTAANVIAGGTTSFTDSSTDATIAVAESFDTALGAPFSTVDRLNNTITRQEFNYAWGPFLGKYHFWVGDPVKRGYIYWNTAGNASLYNILNGVTSVSDPGESLQNGFIFSSLPFVFSRLNLYALDYGGPDSIPEFTPRLISIGLGLAGKWAFAVAPNAVFFLSRDGIYATDCQPGSAISLTEGTLKPIFQGITKEDLSPLDWTKVDEFRMTASAKELHFFYTGVDTNSYHLVYDFERKAWTRWSSLKYSDNTASCYTNAYADEGAPTTRLILGKLGEKSLFSIDDTRPTQSQESFPVVARTNSFTSDIPLTYKEYGTLQLDIDTDSTPCTFTPYYSGETVQGTTVNIIADNPDPGREDYSYTLGDVYARSIGIEFGWTESPTNHPIFYGGTIMFREDEEKLAHWEMPPTAFGQGGFFHIKDGYFTLRSDSTVRLTVVIDGTITDTYDIPSTAGARKKQYVEFKPRKGKVYQLSLDSLVGTDPAKRRVRPFRFYGEDSLLRGKPWITGASYQEINPFGAVGYAQYRRTEGGT